MTHAATVDLPQGPAVDTAWHRALRWTGLYVAILVGSRVLAVALAHGAAVRREAWALGWTVGVGAGLCVALWRRVIPALTAAVWVATVGPVLVTVAAVGLAATGALGPWGIARALASALAASLWGLAMRRMRTVVTG